MSNYHEQLAPYAKRIRNLLSAGSVDEQSGQLCECVSDMLNDQKLVDTVLPDREPGAHPREVLYEDPELKFCICGHVYAGEAVGEPHDHGPSWAIYGQASGTTEMTDWKIVQKADANHPNLVEPVRTYTLSPGNSHYYAIGAVHSPNRARPVKLIRIEGENLDHIQRSPIRAK